MDPTIDEGYFPPEEALEKLRSARRSRQTVFLYGATGYGKTSLVKHFLAGRRYLYLSCPEGPWTLDRLPTPPKKKTDTPSIVVIDGLPQREERQQQLLALLDREDLWVILISRSAIPAWLIPEYIRRGFSVIGEEQFYMDGETAAKLLSRFSLELEPAALNQLLEQCQHNPYALRLSAQLLSQGTPMGPELLEAGERLFADYLENAVFTQWDPELLEFLMSVSVVEEFTASLAEMITGSGYVQRLLRQASETGSFLTETDGVYHLRPIVHLALRRRMEQVCGSAQVRECLYNAGLYYEMRGQVSKALACYESSGRDTRIRDLLIRNARCNPGNGHYYELRKYYLRLKPQDIQRSPMLMSAMSMLYSMLMQPEQSEYWYEKLSAYEKNARGGEKREARSQLTYLDIALPHRGSRGILHLLKSLPALLDKGVSLPEFSVTSNTPSIMNGGKDFCHWSKYDRELAASVGKLVSGVLGPYGRGLVNTALGESLYEKCADSYEVMPLLTRGDMEIQSGGRLEMAFVVAGLKVRLYLQSGDLETAKLQLTAFEKRAREEDALNLLPNIAALRCRLSLYEGDMKAVRAWLAVAPDEGVEFCTLERYRYLTKVRCYLALGENLRALALLEQLRYYAGHFSRTYIRMEVALLTAIARQREDIPWQPDFLATLREISGYRFLRLITGEAGAAAELLRLTRKEYQADKTLDRTWLDRVTRETGDMARRYPLYLKRNLSARLDFSENALMVLRLQADGLSTTQIAAHLGIRPETVKYHAKENYRKLGVSDKGSALLAARDLNLL